MTMTTHMHYGTGDEDKVHLSCHGDSKNKTTKLHANELNGRVFDATFARVCAHLCVNGYIFMEFSVLFPSSIMIRDHSVQHADRKE